MSDDGDKHPDLFGGLTPLRRPQKRTRTTSQASFPHLPTLDKPSVDVPVTAQKQPPQSRERLNRLWISAGGALVLISGALSYVPQPLKDGIGKFISENVTKELGAAFDRAFHSKSAERTEPARPAQSIETGSINAQAPAKPQEAPPAPSRKPKSQGKGAIDRKTPSIDPPDAPGPIVKIVQWFDGILKAIVSPK